MIVMDPNLDFASRLVKVIKPNLIDWATGEGSFVVVGLLEALSGKDREEVISILKQHASRLDKACGTNKGTKIILSKVTG